MSKALGRVPRALQEQRVLLERLPERPASRWKHQPKRPAPPASGRQEREALQFRLELPRQASRRLLRKMYSRPEQLLSPPPASCFPAAAVNLAF